MSFHHTAMLHADTEFSRNKSFFIIFVRKEKVLRPLARERVFREEGCYILQCPRR